ncbi:hypothetical protein [Paraburkholderia sp.]|uniref:hypothetical protein n=1 Tax=Paraburkholderia sp. TaxID=1926495 RepID=UPI003C75AABD
MLETNCIHAAFDHCADEAAPPDALLAFRAWWVLVFGFIVFAPVDVDVEPVDPFAFGALMPPPSPPLLPPGAAPPPLPPAPPPPLLLLPPAPPAPNAEPANARTIARQATDFFAAFMILVSQDIDLHKMSD